MNNIIFASVISEIQQSPMFMTIKCVICDTPEANLNGAKVTEKFVNEVVKNEKRYVGLPLYADVKALTNGNYNRLGHLYDVKTGEFHSTQIGSFYKFEKEEFEKGYHLIGYARIPKRNKKLSNAISELYNDGRLKFSFEVAVGEYDENDDGTITIDASENNYLEGTAIVTYPACEDAVALELVAEKKDGQDGGEKEMAENENKVVKVEETAEKQVEEKMTAEEEKVEEASKEEVKAEEAKTEEVKAEEAKAEEDETKEDDETAACKKKENAEETAEVYTTETKVEGFEVHAYDSETGKSVHQEVTIRTTTDNVLDGTLVESEDGIHVAAEEAGDDPGTETPVTDTPVQQDPPANPVVEPAVEPVADAEVEETPVTDAVDPQRKTAEQMIAELTEVVESLRKEIAELKEKKVVAEVTPKINPLMADINTQKAYTLLEKAGKNYNSYSLLEKY